MTSFIGETRACRMEFFTYSYTDMPLKFYNTLTQQVEAFAPAGGKTVRMYTCGPTVYDYAHIGNFRTFTFVDILRRWLRASGYDLDHVMNITDVDDRIIQNAVGRYTVDREYTAAYTRLSWRTPARGAEARKAGAGHQAHRRYGRGHRAPGRGRTTYVSDGSCISESPPSRLRQALSHRLQRHASGARWWLRQVRKEYARDFACGRPPRRENPLEDRRRGTPGWHIELLRDGLSTSGETLDIHARRLGPELPAPRE